MELSRATLGGTMLGLLSRFASTFQSAVEGRGNFSSPSSDSVETVSKKKESTHPPTHPPK